MTVVVAFKYKNKAVMLADSRAASSVVEDKLQKILISTVDGVSWLSSLPSCVLPPYPLASYLYDRSRKCAILNFLEYMRNTLAKPLRSLGEVWLPSPRINLSEIIKVFQTVTIVEQTRARLKAINKLSHPIKASSLSP